MGIKAVMYFVNRFILTSSDGSGLTNTNLLDLDFGIFNHIHWISISMRGTKNKTATNAQSNSIIANDLELYSVTKEDLPETVSETKLLYSDVIIAYAVPERDESKRRPGDDLI